MTVKNGRKSFESGGEGGKIKVNEKETSELIWQPKLAYISCQQCELELK